MKLDAERDILELVHRYAWAVDDLNVAAVVACFAPDARLTFVSTSTVLEGCEAIRAFFDSALGDSGSSSVSTHFMGNSSIVLGPDGRCGVRTAAVVYVAAVGDDAGVTVRGITYTDVCRLTEDGWRFAQREHRLRWQGGMTGGARTSETV